MYSHWQAAWRSASIIGVAALAFAATRLWAAYEIGDAPRSSFVIATTVAVCAYSAVLAVAFRCGLFLSRIGRASLTFVLTTAIVYLLALAPLAVVPVETSAVIVDMPFSQTRVANFLLNAAPIAIVLFALIALPLATSYCVALFTRRPASVA